MKKIIASLLLIAMAIAGSTLLTGCATVEEEDSQIPWSRPQSWEGNVPGMPQQTG